jgi:hypothetical protein
MYVCCVAERNYGGDYEIEEERIGGKIKVKIKDTTAGRNYQYMRQRKKTIDLYC